MLSGLRLPKADAAGAFGRSAESISAEWVMAGNLPPEDRPPVLIAFLTLLCLLKISFMRSDAGGRRA
jgi:hypothetical protein